MIDVAFYLVSESIARRSGAIASKYRTKDNKFILDNKDLARIRLTSEEYVNGLSGVEMITLEQAKELIAENRYTMGEAPTSVNQTSETENASVVEEPTSEEPTNENENEEVVEPTEDGNQEGAESETTEEQPTDGTSSEEEVVEEEEAPKTTRKK